jgi:hypothetical protein
MMGTIRWKGVIWLLAACAAGMLARSAHGFVLCARGGDGDPNEGASVKVRSVCKDNESALDPATLGASASAISTIVRTGNQISTNGTVSSPANCEAGEVATGGGAIATGADGGLPAIRSSRPQPDLAGATPTAWRTTVTNISTTGTITATAYVVCARTTP